MNLKLCYFNKEELLIHLMVTFKFEEIYNNNFDYLKCINFDTIHNSLKYYNEILIFRNWNKIPLSIKIFFENIKYILKNNLTHEDINLMNFSFSKNISNLVDSYEESWNTDSFSTILNKMGFDNIEFLTEVRHSCIHKTNYDSIVIKKAIEILVNNLIRLYFIPLIKNNFQGINELIFLKLIKYFNIQNNVDYLQIFYKYNTKVKVKLNEENDLFDIKEKLEILKNDKSSDLINKEERFTLYFNKLKFKFKVKKTIGFLLSKIKYTKFNKEKYILYTNIISNLINSLNKNAFNKLWENKDIKKNLEYILVSKPIYLKYFEKLINSLEEKMKLKEIYNIKTNNVLYSDIDNYLEKLDINNINW